MVAVRTATRRAGEISATCVVYVGASSLLCNPQIRELASLGQFSGFRPDSIFDMRNGPPRIGFCRFGRRGGELGLGQEKTGRKRPTPDGFRAKETPHEAGFLVAHEMTVRKRTDPARSQINNLDPWARCRREVKVRKRVVNRVVLSCLRLNRSVPACEGLPQCRDRISQDLLPETRLRSRVTSLWHLPPRPSMWVGRR